MSTKPAKKKQFGQHFLRDHTPIDCMLATLKPSRDDTVVEIGCGDGVLTRAILNQSPCKALHVFEIDPEWAEVVRAQIDDKRLSIRVGDVMSVDFNEALSAHQPVILMANLPYQITFPLFEKLAYTNGLFKGGIVMIQEEAAQRMVATSGRRYGSISLFLQYHFDFTLHMLVPPQAFNPPPKVNSRLIQFTPRTDKQPLPEPHKFWKFVRACFITPRQTLRNNLKRSGYDWHKLDDATLALRAQQCVLNDFIAMWHQINS